MSLSLSLLFRARVIESPAGAKTKQSGNVKCTENTAKTIESNKKGGHL